MSASKPNASLTAGIALVFGLVGGATFFVLNHEPVEPAEDHAHHDVVDPPVAAAKPVLSKELKGEDKYVETGDLEALRAHKRIRFLVFGDAQKLLQRNAHTKSDDRVQATKLAFELGLIPVFVRVDSFDKLIPELLAGHGDVIASRMTATEARRKRVAFTAPTAVVSEVIVGRFDAPGLEDLKALVGKTVHVRPGTSHEKFLRALPDDQRPTIALFDKSVDDEEAIHRVAEGDIELIVIDSDVLAACQTYEDGVESKLTLRDGAQIAWAVRPGATELHTKANEFLTARSMTGHTKETFKGDLAEIRRRGAIRVITRNNPVTYFLHKGNQHGFDYELAKKIAKDLNLRLEIVVPPSFGEMMSYLVDGKGDFIAGQLTATDARKKTVAFSLPYIYVNEILVKKKGAPEVESLADLAGKTIHVREKSSYHETLSAMKDAPFTVAVVPENMETEAILAKVAAGEIEYTVADDTILSVEMAYGREVEPALALTQAHEDATDIIGKQTEGGDHIAFAVRKENKALLEFLNAWVNKNYRGIEYNVLKKRYFENERQIDAAHDERFGASGKISPYDELIKKYSTHYGLDWRLMAAQAYQESRFDPNAVSWVGAQGLFQVMPRTGKELGFTDLKDPEIGIHAGIKYMAQLVGQFEDSLDYRQRMRFALASYNAGRGHVQDARRLAKKRGLDPNRWFNNVEKALLLLQERKYAKQARYGYCRGEEPVRYVSQIQSKYDAFSKLVK